VLSEEKEPHPLRPLSESPTAGEGEIKNLTPIKRDGIINDYVLCGRVNSYPSVRRNSPLNPSPTKGGVLNLVLCFVSEESTSISKPT